MSRRAVSPSALNASMPTILVDANITLSASDTTTYLLSVQAAGVTVTLPQNPQPGITTYFVQAANAFYLSGGAANPLAPGDPMPVSKGAAFTVAFTATGWLFEGSLTSAQALGSQNFGSGADGSATFDGSQAVAGASRSGSIYTLTRDVQYTSALIQSGVTVATAGFRVSFTGMLTNNGTIRNAGGAAALGVAGTAAPGASLGGGSAGGAGAVDGAVGTAATAMGASVRPMGSGAGAAGGAATNAGGAGGTLQTTSSTSYMEPFALLHCALLTGSSTSVLDLGGGTGGGGGGGAGAGAVGGGGGGGGGIVGLFGYGIVNNGTIHADGGAGAAGTGTADAGGGGGGGGGAVNIMTRLFGDSGGVPGTGTVRAAGGAAGAGGGAGAAGTAGATGSVNVLAA